MSTTYCTANLPWLLNIRKRITVWSYKSLEAKKPATQLAQQLLSYMLYFDHWEVGDQSTLSSSTLPLSNLANRMSFLLWLSRKIQLRIKKQLYNETNVLLNEYKFLCTCEAVIPTTSKTEPPSSFLSWRFTCSARSFLISLTDHCINCLQFLIFYFFSSLFFIFYSSPSLLTKQLKIFP